MTCEQAWKLFNGVATVVGFGVTVLSLKVFCEVRRLRAGFLLHLAFGDLPKRIDIHKRNLDNAVQSGRPEQEFTDRMGTLCRELLAKIQRAGDPERKYIELTEALTELVAASKKTDTGAGARMVSKSTVVIELLKSAHRDHIGSLS